MKKILTITSLVIFIGASYGQSISNEVITSSGETLINSTNEIDYSIGEITIETHSNSSNTITQGFHQPLTISVNIQELTDSPEMVIYPNPASEIVYIVISNNDQKFIANIYSIEGKLIESKSISKETSFNTSNYASGKYLITLKQNDQLIKTYQIIKE